MSGQDQMNGDSAAPRPVRRRRMFYIPGYDPFPPRRYRELYRREGEVQARLSGYRLQVAPRMGRDAYGWHVTAQMDGARTETEVTVLIWADLVRESMARGVVATYWLLARTFWIYLSTGAMGRLFRLRRGPVITAMYPVAVLLGQLVLAVGLGWGAIRGLSLLAAPVWLSVPVGLAAAAGLLVWFRRIDGKLYAQYLLHNYGFTAQHYGRTPPALTRRLQDFAEEVERALASDVDEVLVVGHSSGAHLGVEALAEVLRRAAQRHRNGPALAFLTLGQAIPMQSFLPEATRLRADLHLLSGSDALTWVDVSAPGDGCCYALCDPVAVSGAAAEPRRWPLVLSAAFSQTLKPETWRRLRRRYFRLHFQYLCAFDNPGHYDYFRITAGPMTLAERYAGMRPSPSRKETVLSPHTHRAEATPPAPAPLQTAEAGAG